MKPPHTKPLVSTPVNASEGKTSPSRSARPGTLKEALAMKAKVGRSKYRNRRTEVDGRWFDSAKEAARYLVLKAAQRGGHITGLDLQPNFSLNAPDGTLVGEYRADFAYWQKPDGHIATGNPPVACLTWIVEDVKGFKTAIYRRSKKHFQAQYGLKILET